MKIAILSDIHGNLPALQVVAADIARWQPDEVVVAGDIVNRGPHSLACWQFMHSEAVFQTGRLIKGNHEEYVLSHRPPAAELAAAEVELARVSHWTYRQLDGAVSQLAALPDGVSLAGGRGQEVRVRHASMAHNRDGIHGQSAADEVAAQIAPPPAVFVTAHTHRPFVRRVNGTLVVNAGSVGTPADGDGRASYARIQQQAGGWEAQIVRLPYDYGWAQRAYFQTGLLAEAGPLAWLIYYEWQLAHYLFPQWMRDWWPRVARGEVDAETAVAECLAGFGLPAPAF